MTLGPHRAGVRASRSTGTPVYVFEFTPIVASATDTPYEAHLMDAIEQYVTDLIVKALHKRAPALSAADDAKVSKAVQDFVTTGMDLAAVYFALRAAKAGAK